MFIYVPQKERVGLYFIEPMRMLIDDYGRVLFCKICLHKMKGGIEVKYKCPIRIGFTLLVSPFFQNELSSFEIASVEFEVLLS